MLAVPFENLDVVGAEAIEGEAAFAAALRGHFGIELADAAR